MQHWAKQQQGQKYFSFAFIYEKYFCPFVLMQGDRRSLSLNRQQYAA